MGWIVIICACITVGSLAFAYCCWWSEKRILNKMDKMLDEAIRGDFLEKDFDESLLSSVETKLADYLWSEAVSSRNLREEKDKIKSLIGDISHQTKTPLANVLLYTQLLEEHDLPVESRTCVTSLERQVKKLQSLILSLVKTSRLETGILALHPNVAPIDLMLEEATAEFKLKAEAKKIILHIEPTEETAVFDTKWTEEAIGNLLDNAIKYTPIGGKINISVISYDLFCRIDVADNGMGIKEDEQAKIFGRFYRSDVVHESEGVGIGLYLVRQIATSQGGYVKVSSTPGVGSIFSLYLSKS